MHQFYLEVMALADQMQNVSLACRKSGISRSRFYELKKQYEADAPQPRRKPRMPNQTSREIEDRILELTRRYPTYSYLRISAKLRAQGDNVTPSAVRGVWERHGLTARDRRLNWLMESTGTLPQRYSRFVRSTGEESGEPDVDVAAAPEPSPFVLG